MKIKAVYCSNYNGLYLSTEDDQQLDADKVDDVVAIVTDVAIDFCDDDGTFFGNIDDVEILVVATIKEHFGDGVEVEFEEDCIST